MYKIISCNIFKDELKYLMDEDRFKDVIFMEQGLHNTPYKMKEELQRIICELEAQKDIINNYDGLILLYGLCGNGTLGLKSSKLKLIIPRAHDCMTIFLGSKERYKSIISKYQGVYWFNHYWIEQTPMPCKENLRKLKEEYFKNYDEDNAKYLYEIQLDSYLKYKSAILITLPMIDNEEDKNFVKESCKTFNWDYVEKVGCVNLLRNIVNGIFEEEDVLILQPNEVIQISLDDWILRI